MLHAVWLVCCVLKNYGEREKRKSKGRKGRKGRKRKTSVIGKTQCQEKNSHCYSFQLHFRNPTASSSQSVGKSWLPYSLNAEYYLEITDKPTLQEKLQPRLCPFWTQLMPKLATQCNQSSSSSTKTNNTDDQWKHAAIGLIVSAAFLAAILVLLLVSRSSASYRVGNQEKLLQWSEQLLTQWHSEIPKAIGNKNNFLLFLFYNISSHQRSGCCVLRQPFFPVFFPFMLYTNSGKMAPDRYDWHRVRSIYTFAFVLSYLKYMYWSPKKEHTRVNLWVSEFEWSYSVFLDESASDIRIVIINKSWLWFLKHGAQGILIYPTAWSTFLALHIQQHWALAKLIKTHSQACARI